MTWNNID